jgi:ribosomal protein L16/L10AE
MADKTVMQLAIDAASARKVSRTMEAAVGSKFWQKGYREANRRLKEHMKQMHRLSDKAADETSDRFMAVFATAAQKFGKDLQKAAATGSQEFEDAMIRALRKINDIQTDNDEERRERVENIIDEELRGLDKIAKKRNAMDRDRDKLSDDLPGMGGRYGKAAQGAGNKVGALGDIIGGKAGGMLKGAGGVIGKAGPYLAVASAALELAKAMHQVHRFVTELNKSMLQTVSWVDITGAGFANVTDGVSAMRHEFMANVSANAKWRMTAQEGYEAINGFTQAGLNLDRMLRATGGSADDAGTSFRKFSDLAMTYSTAFGVSVGEIGKVSTDMMIDLNYNLQQTKDAFSTIRKGAIESGVSANRFFATVQSVNSQLDLMNAHLKTQTNVLSDIISKSALGAKDAADQAGKLMGKLDFDQAAKSLAYLGPQAADMFRASYEDLVSYMQSEEFQLLDPKQQARIKMQAAELKDALENPIAEGADYLASGLASETDLMAVRLATVAEKMGKTIDTFRPEDLERMLNEGISFDDRKFLEAIGGVGAGTEEVQKILMAMAGTMEDGETASDALKRLRTEERMHSDELSMEERLAQEQAQNTKDIATILTNIKEMIYSKLYDVLLMIYDVLVHQFGNDRDKILAAYDRAAYDMTSSIGSLEAQVAADPTNETAKKQLEEQKEIYDAIIAERKQIEQASDDQMATMVETYGPTADWLLKKRLGKGMGGVMGDTAQVGRSDMVMESSAEKKQRIQEGVDAFKAAPAALTADKDANRTLLDQYGLSVTEIRDLYNEQNPMPAGIIGSAWGSRTSRAGITEEALAVQIAKEMGIIPMKDGGIVTRPTVAMIGEAGPEAVVPLRGGGGMNVTIHINGGDLQAVRREVENALRVYDKSQRV